MQVHNEGSSLVAQLMTTLHSKSTNVKWRIKVLKRSANLFTLLFVNYRKLCISTRSIMPPFVKTKKYIPVYSDNETQF